MSGLFIDLLAAEIADAAACVFGRITVEQLSPEAVVWYPDTVVVARNRREITHDQDRVFRLLAFSQHRNHARLSIVAVDPFKARRIAVEFMKRRFVAEGAVQLFNPLLHA